MQPEATTPSRQCACRAGPGGSPHRGGSPGTGTGRREPLAWRTGRGVRAERGAKTQASPFRPLLSPVRTGRRLVPTALLPSPPHPPPGSAPGRRGRMLGKQASQRLLETETPRDTETDTKGKVSVQSERGGRCEPAGPGSVGTGRPWPRGGAPGWPALGTSFWAQGHPPGGLLHTQWPRPLCRKLGAR